MLEGNLTRLSCCCRASGACYCTVPSSCCCPSSYVASEKRSSLGVAVCRSCSPLLLVSELLLADLNGCWHGAAATVVRLEHVTALIRRAAAVQLLMLPARRGVRLELLFVGAALRCYWF
uniref:Uncharacterized protein n=1 Tax=Solanum lycopersicum TaxID=4081 RepID=A0A3Q7G4D1_SOLLC